MKRISLFFLTILLTTSAVALAEGKAGRDAQRDNQRQPRVWSLRGGGFRGVRLEEVTGETVKRLNLREERGALLTEVLPDSPAAKAGLQKDDVIIRWNGERVDSAMELQRLKRETPAGRSVRIGVVRNGSEIELDMELAEPSSVRVQVAPAGARTISRNFRVRERGRMGIELQGMTSQLSEYFGVPEGTGALVTSVREDSPAARAGIKAGDVILSIGGEKIEGPVGVMRALRQKQEGAVEVKVLRNKQEMSFSVQLEKGANTSEVFLDDDSDQMIIEPFDFSFSMPAIEIPEIEPMVLELPHIKVPGIGPMAIQSPHIEIPAIAPMVIEMPRIEIPAIAPMALPLPRINLSPLRMNLWIPSRGVLL